jgi:hypothetical protein
MSEKCIFDIIALSGFNLKMHDSNSGIFEFIFRNNFQNNISNYVEPELSVYCKTKDCMTINSNVHIGFKNDDLIKVKSPGEAIKTFEWLMNVNNVLEKSGYKGTFNNQLYKNNRAHSFTYIVSTCYMEDFQKMLTDFTDAYLSR